MRTIGLFPTSTIENILYHGTDKYTPSTLGVACKTWFTVKQKNVKPTGEEINEEREVEFTDVDLAGEDVDDEREIEVADVELAGDALTRNFERCLELMGYECYFNKIKYTYGFYIQLKSTDMGDRPMVYHVEVERVELGDDAADDEIIDESDTEEVDVEEENDDISEDVISTDDIFGVESVDKSVLYVEIENTDSDDSIDSEIILNQIKQIFNLLGLDPEKADSRSWLKILKGDN